MSRGRRALLVLVAAAAALVLAGDAVACVCLEATADERLDQADAAVVGRIVSDTPTEVAGVAQRSLTVAVEQRVKGDVDGTLVVRAPSGTDCDVELELDETTGLFLTRVEDGSWFASACSVVAPGELVAAGGEPRGGAIKVAIGILILALVVSWALRRKARGTRPRLPGAPGQ